MGGRSHITLTQLEEAISYGKKMPVIAKELNVTRQCISHLIQKHDLSSFYRETFPLKQYTCSVCGKATPQGVKRCEGHPKKNRVSHCVKCGKEIPKDKRCLFSKCLSCYYEDKPKAVCRVCGEVKLLKGRGACYSCYSRVLMRVRAKRSPETWRKVKAGEKYRKEQEKIYHEMLNDRDQSKKSLVP